MKPIFKTLSSCIFLFIAGPAFANCATATAPEEIKSCLAQDLRDSDARINAAYKLLMASHDAAGQTLLRNEQRAWLKKRDATCSLDNKETDREKWLQTILASDAKTMCVTRYTFARVTALNDLLPRGGAAQPMPAAPQAPRFELDLSAAAPRNMAYHDEGYMIASTVAQAKGKWYFELSIDRGQIAQLGDVLLETGYHNPEGHGVVLPLRIHRTETGKGSANVGFAIDLDNGGAYARADGNWREAPGSNTGLQ
ncbi:MAG TPA: lysozyme inhibitor LprI family protein, partial [Rhizomicrobium sp.]|nr:lysozyme inhibitor LprI family protein [Rhizomicrobium sp.]